MLVQVLIQLFSCPEIVEIGDVTGEKNAVQMVDLMLVDVGLKLETC